MTRSISPARPGGDAPSEELGLEMLADSSDATSSTKAFTCQVQAAWTTLQKCRWIHATWEEAVAVCDFED